MIVCLQPMSRYVNMVDIVKNTRSNANFACDIPIIDVYYSDPPHTIIVAILNLRLVLRLPPMIRPCVSLETKLTLKIISIVRSCSRIRAQGRSQSIINVKALVARGMVGRLCHNPTNFDATIGRGRMHKYISRASKCVTGRVKICVRFGTY